jgi:DNA-binding NtrC family response regulator
MTDWVLGQFSRKRSKAEQEYRQFVHWGIGQKTIWTEVRGQSLLGEATFMDKLTDHLKKHKDIPEIPRSQRYATRPALAVLLPDGVVEDQKRLLRKLSEAVEQHGYRQSELARHVGVHYSTISRWLREYENARRKT